MSLMSKNRRMRKYAYLQERGLNPQLPLKPKILTKEMSGSGGNSKFGFAFEESLSLTESREIIKKRYCRLGYERIL